MQGLREGVDSRPLKRKRGIVIRQGRLTLHAERQEASNRRFASNPPQRSAGPQDIERSAPLILSLSAAPPACGFGGDHTLHLRDSAPPSNRRYIGTECPLEPV